MEKKLDWKNGQPATQKRPDVEDLFMHVQEGVGPARHRQLQDPKNRAKYLEHLAWRSGILLGATMGLVGGFVIGVIAGVYGA